MNALLPHAWMHWILSASIALAGCGGGTSSMQTSQSTSAQTNTAAPMPSATTPMPGTAMPPPPASSLVLPPPQLRFSDTGVSVSDAITRDGRWSVVSSGLGWEYSLDLGKSWEQGIGEGFEVKGEGPKTIWVRARDDRGNTSEVVVVGCVLDTTPPSSPALTATARGALDELRLDALEAQALWEYSVDGQRTWYQAEGSGLLVYGNGLQRIALRQVDLAGNPSAAVVNMLPSANSTIDPLRHEASSNPLSPTILGEPGPVAAAGLAPGTMAGPSGQSAAAIGRSVLVHGEVVRGDADYLRIDVPAGYRLHALRLVYYESEDSIAFFAVQRASVFDAGVDTKSMAAWGHLGPQDQGKNLIQGLPEAALGSGPLVLWVQQTGEKKTLYAMQLDLRSTL